MALYTLVYVSFARHDFSDPELIELLRVSRENNGKLDVTGMLLYRNRFFIQVLEGERETVRSLFNKIKKDPRHEGVLMVYDGPIATRTFSSWKMGFNKLDETRIPEGVDGYSEFLKNPTAEYLTKSPKRTEILLRNFAQRSAL